VRGRKPFRARHERRRRRPRRIALEVQAGFGKERRERADVLCVQRDGDEGEEAWVRKRKRGGVLGEEVGDAEGEGAVVGVVGDAAGVEGDDLRVREMSRWERRA
jgi:hypothetical protein